MPNMATIDLIGLLGAHSLFEPVNIVGGEATFVKSTGVPLADQTIKMKASRTPSGRVKVDAKITIPIVQDMTVNGVTKPTVVRTSYFNCTWNASADSTVDERFHLMILAKDLVGQDGTSIAMFKDLKYLT
jgi:hypothetical protein